MRRIALAFASALAMMCASAPSATGAEPLDGGKMGRLALDSAYIDMGRVPRDTVAEAVMRFRNVGDAPLTILRIFSECGCTTPDYSSDPVEPGDSGEIRIRFNSRNRLPGAFRKTLRIRSDAANPRETLVVKGRVD